MTDTYFAEQLWKRPIPMADLVDAEPNMGYNDIQLQTTVAAMLDTSRDTSKPYGRSTVNNPISIPANHKKCKICGIIKPASDFYARMARCKTCVSLQRGHKQPRSTIAFEESGIVGILLTRGLVARVDAIDSDLASYRWYAAKRRFGATHYAHRDIGPHGSKHRFILHRVIMSRMIGRELRPDEIVDHIDCNGLNNTRCNLRLADHSQNLFNQTAPIDNTSGYKGVSHCNTTGRWKARIRAYGVEHWLGRFDTPEEAYAAYCEAAKELHGEFANINSPKEGDQNGR